MKNPAVAQIEELERMEREKALEAEESMRESRNDVNSKGIMRKGRKGRSRLSPEDVEEIHRSEKMTAFLNKHFSKFIVLALLLCCIPVLIGVYDLLYGAPYEVRKDEEACTRTYTLPSNKFCSAVDLVYTWVNGSDPKLRADYRRYAQQQKQQQHTGITAVANNDNDDDDVDDEEGPLLREMPTLKYSIRAADTFAPWIRRIWVVTNGQVPSWLNTSSPRVRVVTHAEIFANTSDLPTFNSNAIEANLHRIPGLAPCWFYQNDDFGFGRPVCLKDFLALDTGRQRLAFDTFYAPEYRAMSKNTWHRSVGFSNTLLNSYYYADTTFVHGHFYEGHNTRLFRTDVLKTMAERWAAQYKNTSAHRFRDPYDIALPFLYNNVVLTEFGGIKDRALFASFLYEKFLPSQKVASKIVAKIRSEKPLSWCVNDGAGRAASQEKREEIAKATQALAEEMEKWLPTPSNLELEDGSGPRDTIPVTMTQEAEQKRRKKTLDGNSNEEPWAKSFAPWFGLIVVVWGFAVTVYSYRVYKVCKVLFNDTNKIREA